MNLKIFVIGACSFPTVKYVRNGTKAIAMQIIEDTAECLHFVFIFRSKYRTNQKRNNKTNNQWEKSANKIFHKAIRDCVTYYDCAGSNPILCKTFFSYLITYV